MGDDARRRAAIIGGGAGIGLATAELFATDGYDLVVGDINDASFPDLRRRLGASCSTVDLTDLAAIEAFGEAAKSIDVLVIAAGISQSMGDFDKVLEVNLVGCARAVEAIGPRVRRGGAIVCLSSMAGYLATPLSEATAAAVDEPLSSDFVQRVREAVGSLNATSAIAYSVSKVGILRLVQRAAPRWGEHDVRICSVSPGPIETPMGDVERKARPSAYLPVKYMPVPRMGAAGEVADVIAFLASSRASFITGADILVDGGWVAASRTLPPSSPFQRALTSR